MNHPTLDQLLALRLTGMAKALSEQMDLPESQALSFEERLGLLVDREMTVRSDRRLTTRLRQAKLRLSASLEDIDYRHPRGLDKALMLRLASCPWVHERHNVLITGPTGIGKTWLACALGHKACREGYTVLYLRLPRLLQELPIAKGDGRYLKLMASLAKTALLISMTGDWRPSVMSTDVMCSNSWKTGTGEVRPLSPVSSRWTTGMTPLGIPPWLMPSLTGGSITRTRLPSEEIRCANGTPS